jgi:hypothetical protein
LAEEEGAETRLSRSGASARVERYFQKRLQGHGWQVLRYAYGGKPLWSTHFPRQIVTCKKEIINSPPLYIPVCEICGANRIFEFQLMPALLSLLEKGNDGKEHGNKFGDSGMGAEKRSVTVQDLLIGVLGEGLDFGVVAVWSCPNSCCVPIAQGVGETESGGGRRFAVESAVVQPPPDHV